MQRVIIFMEHFLSGSLLRCCHFHEKRISFYPQTHWIIGWIFFSSLVVNKAKEVISCCTNEKIYIREKSIEKQRCGFLKTATFFEQKLPPVESKAMHMCNFCKICRSHTVYRSCSKSETRHGCKMKLRHLSCQIIASVWAELKLVKDENCLSERILIFSSRYMVC